MPTTLPTPPRLLLPPLPRAGDATAELTSVQRRWMVAGILGLHAAGAWGLLQIDAVRDAVREVVPLFVEVVASPAPPAPPQPATMPQAAPVRPVAPVTPLPVAPLPVVTAAPSPAPAPATVVPAPAPAPLTAPAVTAAAPPAPPTPPAPPPAAPRLIPPSALQFVDALVVVYPRLSRRNGEAGLVVVRALVDTAGVPRQLQVETSSGFVRLDEAALAAVQKARLKPHTENGQPVEGWARFPIHFELEK